MTNRSRLAASDVPDEPSDAELITATRTGDTAAYGSLYLRHIHAANRMARTLTSDASTADDLVAEAFARILLTLRAGNGPDQAFRAYLLTSVRNAFYDQTRRDRRVEVTDDLTRFETGEPFQDTATDKLDRTLAARAFARLPERWQTVVWHTAIEGESPAEVAPLLGLTPNGVAALAYRARERLKQLYLQEHIAETVEPDCRWTAEHLGPAVRDGLAKRDRQRVDDHLSTCARCQVLYTELRDVNSGIPLVLLPAVLGPTWAAYLGAGGIAKGGLIAGVIAWFQHSWHAFVAWGKALLVKVGPRNAAIGGGATAVAAAVVAALLLMSSTAPPPKPRAVPPPPATRPPASQPAAPPAHNPPVNPPVNPPPVNPPAHPPAHPTPAKPPPKRPKPTPKPPAGKPYRITTPALSVGTLTAGTSDGSLPITISNPATTGGTGGGGGSDPVPLSDVHRVPDPLPGPALPAPAAPAHHALPALPPAAGAPPIAGLPAASRDGTAAPALRQAPGSPANPGSSSAGTPSASATPTAGGGIVMTVTLPAPITFNAATGVGGGWTCAVASGGARCRHALLAPGAKAVATLHVNVGDLAGFQSVGVRLAAGGTSADSSFTVVVAPAGMTTGYAASGNQSVATAGNRFGSCHLGHNCHDGICRPTPWHHGDPWPWPWHHGSNPGPWHHGSNPGPWHHGGDPVWHCPSSATLTLPAGARVRYATLTWSVSGYWRGDQGSLAVTGPHGVARTVRGSAQGGNQWQADVTGLVGTGGAGTWTATTNGDWLPPSGGWGLLVVVSVPGAPDRNVAVFQGRASADPIALRLSGPAGPADLAVLNWQGAGLLRLGGASTTSTGVATAQRAAVGVGARGSVTGGRNSVGGLAIAGPR